MELHSQLMHDRDKIHAHTDLSVLDPKLVDINKISGITYTLITKNVDLRFEKIKKIDDIIKMIKGTLDNIHMFRLYTEEQILNEKMKQEKSV